MDFLISWAVVFPNFQLNRLYKCKENCNTNFITSRHILRFRLTYVSQKRLCFSSVLRKSAQEKRSPSKPSQPWPFYVRQQRSHVLCLSKTALAHALIALPWPSRSGWVSQRTYMKKKLARIGRGMSLPSTKGYSRLLPAEPAVCFSCKRLATFCKEMYEKLACPG